MLAADISMLGRKHFSPNKDSDKESIYTRSNFTSTNYTILDSTVSNPLRRIILKDLENEKKMKQEQEFQYLRGLIQTHQDLLIFQKKVGFLIFFLILEEWGLNWSLKKSREDWGVEKKSLITFCLQFPSYFGFFSKNLQNPKNIFTGEIHVSSQKIVIVCMWWLITHQVITYLHTFLLRERFVKSFTWTFQSTYLRK